MGKEDFQICPPMGTTEFPSRDERIAASAILLFRRRSLISEQSFLLSASSIDHSTHIIYHYSSTPEATSCRSEIYPDLLLLSDLATDSHQIKSEASVYCSVRETSSPESQLCLDNKRALSLPADSKLIKSSSPMVLSRSKIQKKARSRIYLKQRVMTKLPIGGQKADKTEGENYGDEKGEVEGEVEASTVSSAASNSLWQANKIPAVAVDNSVSSRRRRLGFIKRNWEWTRRPPLTAMPTGVRRQAEAILEYLSSRWASEGEIRSALGDSADTSKALRLLLKRGEIKRSGFGGRADPFQYTGSRCDKLK